MYNYILINSLAEDRYHEASSYYEGFDQRDALRTYYKLRQALMITSTFELCCRLKSFDAYLHVKV
jgi:hypothetical protein